MVVQALGGERCQRGAHLLHRLGLDLADALGRNAKLGGQFVQGGGVAFGQPATLDDHTAAVVEIGMRGLHQIEAMAPIAAPTVGIVTNVGETHMELLGSIENIAKAKSEMVEAIPAGGTVVLNADNPYVAAMRSQAKEGVRVLTFGIEKEADVRAKEETIETIDGHETRFKIEWKGREQTFTFAMVGRHNVYNALAAIAAGKAILVEKAFTATVDDTERIATAAREAGVFAMEAMWTRFNPGIAHVRDVIAAGEVGEIRGCQGDLTAFREFDANDRLFDPAKGGGAVLDLGVYLISFAQHFLGTPEVVNATGTDFECMDVLAHETGTTAPAALRGLETADVRFKDVVAIDGMEDYVEKAAQAL